MSRSLGVYKMMIKFTASGYTGVVMVNISIVSLTGLNMRYDLLVHHLLLTPLPVSVLARACVHVCVWMCVRTCVCTYVGATRAGAGRGARAQEGKEGGEGAVVAICLTGTYAALQACLLTRMGQLPQQAQGACRLMQLQAEPRQHARQHVCTSTAMVAMTAQIPPRPPKEAWHSIKR